MCRMDKLYAFVQLSHAITINQQYVRNDLLEIDLYYQRGSFWQLSAN